MATTRTTKPMITIAREVMVRRSYSVPEEVATALENYALFLSEWGGSKVTPGDIVGKLAAKLGKDPAFLAWKTKPATAAQALAPSTPKDA